MSDVDAVKQLANKEVDHVIRMISVFANLFRNKAVDFERLGVQRESDFYVGGSMGRRHRFLYLRLCQEV